MCSCLLIMMLVCGSRNWKFLLFELMILIIGLFLCLFGYDVYCYCDDEYVEEECDYVVQ